jgi:uncharacterized protein YkwD
MRKIKELFWIGRTTRFMFLIAFMLALSACTIKQSVLSVSVTPTPADSASGQSATTASAIDLIRAAKQTMEGVNAERAQRNLLSLRTDETLAQIAAERSEDMIARDYFSHYDLQTGRRPLLNDLQAQKYAYRYAGENIAELKNDSVWVPAWLTVGARYTAENLASEFVRGWLNSPEHLANMLSTHYRRTGVAVAIRADGRRIVATQVFSD